MEEKEIIRGGRTYLPASYFMAKYDLTRYALRQAERNGLPHIEERGQSWYNERDFHDYYAGKIGKDVEGDGGI